MKIATSILDCNDMINGVLKLNETDTSYIHVDVMDGKFVPREKFMNLDVVRGISKVSKYPLDMHLMLVDPISYIEKLGDLNIKFITIHLEINKDLRPIFSKIRDLGYKIGVSINPRTDIHEVEPYFDDIDMILIMSVEPGLGGQKFMDSTILKVNQLRQLFLKSGRDILIEVDGGINNETILKLENVDIAVVGSYITKNDNYKDRIDDLLNKVNVEK